MADGVSGGTGDHAIELVEVLEGKSVRVPAPIPLRLKVERVEQDPTQTQRTVIMARVIVSD